MINFKNPWDKGGIHFPRHIGETIDRWFKDGGVGSDSPQLDESGFSASGNELRPLDFHDAISSSDLVEFRAKAVIEVFQEGDYVKTSTLLSLVGITQTASQDEKPFAAGTRDMINHISTVTKSGNTFIINMVNGEDYKTKIQATENFSLWLEIQDGATLTMVDKGTNLEIEVDDINGSVFKYGLLELPNVSLDDNLLTILNIPLVLHPRKR